MVDVSLERWVPATSCRGTNEVNCHEISCSSILNDERSYRAQRWLIRDAIDVVTAIDASTQDGPNVLRVSRNDNIFTFESCASAYMMLFRGAQGDITVLCAECSVLSRLRVNW